MPNICFYSMKVVGKQDNIKKLVEIMNRSYNYYDEETAKNQLPHLWRVFSADIYDEDATGTYIQGDCAWSVHSCMFDGVSTYQGDHKGDPKYKGTTIDALSKELNLKIEIYSEEGGCGFQEHYIINNGLVLVNDCVEYSEEYNEKTGDYVSSGGFVNYLEFAI